LIQRTLVGLELAKRLGSDVEKGNDDLDEFYGAAVWLDELPVVVMHYRGHPADTSTIYLPFEIKDVNEISSIISRVVAELNVREKSIVWQRKDNPEL
jgi:hypothetical protein